MFFFFKKKKINFLILAFIIILISCTKSDPDLIKKKNKIPPLEVLYENGYKKFQDGLYEESIKIFKQFETSYSYSEWSQRATMLIIYMNYDLGKTLKTLEYVKKFKNLYPASKYNAYVDYISALVLYEKIGVASKDQTNSSLALKKFEEILKKYPSSVYAEDAKLKINAVKEMLAAKEMYIARYYMNRSRWIAAIKRLNRIVENYSNTIYVAEALHRLVEVYYNLGNFNKAKEYAAILGYNFNDSDWYKKTYKIINVNNREIKEENEIKKEKIKMKDRIKKLLKLSSY